MIPANTPASEERELKMCSLQLMLLSTVSKYLFLKSEKAFDGSDLSGTFCFPESFF